MELGWIDGTDGRAAADALVLNHARLVEAEVAEFRLAAHWADLHDEGSLGRGTGSGRVLPGTERARRLGGAGTPLVGEFAAAELGCLLGRGPVAASTLIADALDVRHRLPVQWAALESGGARVWQVRHVASRTRSVGLSWEQARWVDGEVAPYLASFPWARFCDLVEAKIIEADPAAAEARRVAAAMERFVVSGQCNEYGLKTVIAKAAAGDAVFFVAMCDRIAQILLLEGDTDPVGARRSKALGVLANPARALLLLERYAGTDVPATSDADSAAPSDPAADFEDDTEDDAGARAADDDGSDADVVDHNAVPDEVPVTPGDVHPWQDDSDDAPEAGCPSCGDTAPARTGDPAAFVKALATIDPKRLLPNATLYVHISRESFDAARTGASTGVARWEGVGAVTIEQVREFLGHTHVTVRPVLDLDQDRPVDGYEVPDRLREQLHLRTPADVFPWSGNLSRRKDLDHTIAYVSPGRGGRPGQTRIGNLGPMSRHAHRVKTHGRGWRHHQPVPGVFLWRTPHGYWFRTDHAGTQSLGKTPSEWELAGRLGPPFSPAEHALERLLLSA